VFIFLGYLPFMLPFFLDLFADESSLTREEMLKGVRFIRASCFFGQLVCCPITRVTTVSWDPLETVRDSVCF
jgi:hypothetical protein